MEAAFQIVMRAMEKPDAARQKVGKTEKNEIIQGLSTMVARAIQYCKPGYYGIGWDSTLPKTLVAKLIPSADFRILDRYDKHKAVNWAQIVNMYAPAQVEHRPFITRMEAVAMMARTLADMRECLEVVKEAEQAARDYDAGMRKIGAKPNDDVDIPRVGMVRVGKPRRSKMAKP